MIKHPLRHKHDLLAVSALVGRRWVTYGDVETLLGISKARAKCLLSYLAENGLAQMWVSPSAKTKCFGPAGDA